MEITYTVNALAKQDVGQFKDVVVHANFTAAGTDGTTTVSMPCAVNLLPPVEGQPFTPFEQLTEAEVVQAIKDGLNQEGVEGEKGVEKQLTAMLLEATKPQPVAAPLPWVKAEEQPS